MLRSKQCLSAVLDLSLAVQTAVGPMPPALSSAFFETHAPPEGCNEAAVKKLMQRGSCWSFVWWSDHASGTPQYIAQCASDGECSQSEYKLDPHGPPLMLRLRGSSQDRFNWFMTAPLGSVDMSQRHAWSGVNADGEDKVLSFANAPQHALSVQAEGVHVAVGFADFGDLAETMASLEESGARTHLTQVPCSPAIMFPTKDCFQTCCKTYLRTVQVFLNRVLCAHVMHSMAVCNSELLLHAEECGKTLRWVGIEASAFMCAKALVLLEMLKQGAATDSVLQVCTHPSERLLMIQRTKYNFHVYGAVSGH